MLERIAEARSSNCREARKNPSTLVFVWWVISPPLSGTKYSGYDCTVHPGTVPGKRECGITRHSGLRGCDFTNGETAPLPFWGGRVRALSVWKIALRLAVYLREWATTRGYPGTKSGPVSTLDRDNMW